MNCDELRDYYELYTLGIAEDPELSEIRAHLERDCPMCVPGVRGARELTTLIGATAPAVEAPARLRKRVLAIAGGRTASRWNWSPVWAAVAAGALIAAIVFNVRAHRASAELAQAAAELQRVQSESAAQTRELARLNEAYAILNQPEAKQVVFGGAAPQNTTCFASGWFRMANASFSRANSRVWAADSDCTRCSSAATCANSADARCARTLKTIAAIKAPAATAAHTGDQFQREAVRPPAMARTRFRSRAGASTAGAVAPIRVVNSRAPRTPGTHMGQSRSRCARISLSSGSSAMPSVYSS